MISYCTVYWTFYSIAAKVVWFDRLGAGLEQSESALSINLYILPSRPPLFSFKRKSLAG